MRSADSVRISRNVYFDKNLFGRDSKRATIHWFISKMARTGLGQSQEPETQSGSPTWVVGTQPLEPSPAASQGLQWQEAGIWSWI